MIQYVDWPSCRAMDLIYAVTRAFIGLLNGCFKALMGVMAGTSKPVEWLRRLRSL